MMSFPFLQSEVLAQWVSSLVGESIFLQASPVCSPGLVGSPWYSLEDAPSGFCHYLHREFHLCTCV